VLSTFISSGYLQGGAVSGVSYKGWCCWTILSHSTVTYAEGTSCRR
jgi:hypothetical protein